MLCFLALSNMRTTIINLSLSAMKYSSDILVLHSRHGACHDFTMKVLSVNGLLVS